MTGDLRKPRLMQKEEKVGFKKRKRLWQPFESEERMHCSFICCKAEVRRNVETINLLPLGSLSNTHMGRPIKRLNVFFQPEER